MFYIIGLTVSILYRLVSVTLSVMPPVRRERERNRAQGAGDTPRSRADINNGGGTGNNSGSGGNGSGNVNSDWEGTHEFLTSCPTEVKDIVWRIKDFSTIHHFKNEDGRHKIKFSAGEKVGIPSKWRMDLLCDDDEKVSNLGYKDLIITWNNFKMT